MDGPEDLPEGVEVAGWETAHGEWVNAEELGITPSDFDLEESYWTVVSFWTDDGELVYKSIMGGVDGWEGLEDAIADLMEEYG